MSPFYTRVISNNHHSYWVTTAHLGWFCGYLYMLNFFKKKFITARYVHPLHWRVWGSSPYSLKTDKMLHAASVQSDANSCNVYAHLCHTAVKIPSIVGPRNFRPLLLTSLDLSHWTSIMIHDGGKPRRNYRRLIPQVRALLSRFFFFMESLWNMYFTRPKEKIEF
jgi:hypothetical protein